MSDQLKRVADRVGCHMTDILELFKAGSKITVIVRNPAEPTQDFCLTNDTLPDVGELIRRRMALGDQSKQR